MLLAVLTALEIRLPMELVIEDSRDDALLARELVSEEALPLRFDPTAEAVRCLEVSFNSHESKEVWGRC